jgi:hypothetical protein
MFFNLNISALNLSLKATPTKKPVKNEVKVEKLTESPEMTKNDKTPVKHSTLPDRSNVVYVIYLFHIFDYL